jgi:hypothetical protein
MRKPDSDIPEKLRWKPQRPYSYLPLLVGIMVALIMWTVAHDKPTNEELVRAYEQGWEAALNTKRVHKDLEGACLTLWWGQNAGNP